MSSGTWGEMLGNNDLIKLQYDLLDGDTKKSAWPNQGEPNPGDPWPILIVVDEYNRIPDYSLFMMGLLTDQEVKYMMAEMVYNMEYSQGLTKEKPEERLKKELGEDFKPYKNAITFDDLIGREYEVLLKGQYYAPVENSAVEYDGKTFQTYAKTVTSNTLLQNEESTKIKVCGIIRLKEGASTGALSQAIYYTPKFTEHLIDKTQNKHKFLKSGL